MRRGATRLLATLAVLLAASAGQAFAAQDSTIIKDSAAIYSEPNSKSKVLEYLPMGMEVRVSSFPMAGGWYKIRSRTGIYGWLNEKFLSVYTPPEGTTNAKDDLSKKGEYRPERDRKWFVRALGGFAFFKPDDLNTLFDFDDLNTGRTLGGEVGVFISERVALAFRMEALAKDVVAKEKNTGLFFNLALRSYPVMGGMDFYFMKLPAMRVSLGLFGGLAFATSFSSEASALDAPNTVVLQRNPFTSYVRVNVTRPLGRVVSVFGELGYRYLRSDEIDTSSARDINGGIPIYARNGDFRARVIDLSGVVIALGVGIHF